MRLKRPRILFDLAMDVAEYAVGTHGKKQAISLAVSTLIIQKHVATVKIATTLLTKMFPDAMNLKLIASGSPKDA